MSLSLDGILSSRMHWMLLIWMFKRRDFSNEVLRRYARQDTSHPAFGSTRLSILVAERSAMGFGCQYISGNISPSYQQDQSRHVRCGRRSFGGGCQTHAGQR
jgi:hypothetical protein